MKYIFNVYYYSTHNTFYYYCVTHQAKIQVTGGGVMN